MLKLLYYTRTRLNINFCNFQNDIEGKYQGKIDELESEINKRDYTISTLCEQFNQVTFCFSLLDIYYTILNFNINS